MKKYVDDTYVEMTPEEISEFQANSGPELVSAPTLEELATSVNDAMVAIMMLSLE